MTYFKSDVDKIIKKVGWKWCFKSYELSNVEIIPKFKDTSCSEKIV